MARTSSSPLARIDEDKALRLVLEGTAEETGQAFFRALVRNLSAALKVPYAWVSEWQPATRRLSALAFWWDDHFVEGYEYEIDGTPCQPVIDGACLAHFPERLFDIFPRDADLPKMDAVSYLGTPILDTDGTLLGHLSVMDRCPMPAEPRLLTLFQIFASCAATRGRATCANYKTSSSARSSFPPAAGSTSSARSHSRPHLLLPRRHPLRKTTCASLPPPNFRNSNAPTSAAHLKPPPGKSQVPRVPPRASVSHHRPSPHAPKLSVSRDPRSPAGGHARRPGVRLTACPRFGGVQLKKRGNPAASPPRPTALSVNEKTVRGDWSADPQQNHFLSRLSSSRRTGLGKRRLGVIA